MEKTCVFCDRSQFEERLVDETDNFNIIATLGQITDGGYALLAPKKHILCAAAMPEHVNEECELLAECLCQIIACEYNSPVTVVEHGIVGQTIKHAHLHFLPADIGPREAIARDFPAAERDVVGSFAGLAKSYRTNPDPYLFWIAPDEPPQVCWSPKAPPQYWRIVAANKLGRPERTNWRTIDQELDRKLWSETLSRLKPYFS